MRGLGEEILSTWQVWVLGLSGLIGIAFLALSLFSGFWHAKNIFTPTRKSIRISGIYLALAGLSCTMPSVFIFSDKVHLFGVVGFIGLVLSPTLAYMGVGYPYVDLEKRRKESL